MSIRNRIVVVDYGMGNIHSIVKKIKHLGGDVFVSSNSGEILKSDKIFTKFCLKYSEKSRFTS